MSDVFFQGRPVEGIVDPQLYFFWCLIHMLDDTMGDFHVVRTSPSLVRPWLDFCNAVDDAFAKSFFREGFTAGCDVVFYFGSD